MPHQDDPLPPRDAPRWPGHRASWLLLIIAAAGLALRLSGLQYGLPDVHNPDEIAIMSRTLGFAKGDFNPHNFLYPTFYFYVLFGWVGLSFVAGWAAGLFESLSAFQRQFFVDPTFVYTAGRLLSVVCGVLTIPVTARLARRAGGNPGAALVAAALMACAPFAVRDAHYVKHDVPVTLLAVVALLAIDRWRRAPASMRAAVVAGAACGAAVSTHYYAVFLALPLTAAPWLSAHHRRGDAPWRPTAAALVSLGAVFVALSPYLLAEPSTAWHDIVANRRIVVDRAVDLGWFGSAGSYARMLGDEAMGWPAFAFACAGAVMLLRRDWRTAAWLLLFPAAFLLFIVNTVPATRYLNPVLPVMAVLAGEGLVAVASLAAMRLRASGGRRAGLTVVLALAVLGPGLAGSVQTGRFFRQTDTRTLAADYIRAHVPDGGTVLTQAYTLQLTPSAASLREAVRVNGVARPSVRWHNQLALAPYPAPAYRTIILGDGTGDPERLYLPYDTIAASAGLGALRSLGVDWVAIKSTAQTPAGIALLRARLDGAATRVAVFSPFAGGAAPEGVRPFLHNADARLDPALERPGPVVELWRLPPVDAGGSSGIK